MALFTPYGFQRDGDALVPLPAEQAVICRIHAHNANGWSLTRIADALNDEGVPTKRGGRWFPQTVKDVLSNAMGEAG
jgi:site-specific DNA recombinase